MPKANEVNITSRRSFVTTMAMAVAVPTVAGAPMAAAPADQPARTKPEISLKDGIDYFANMMLMVPISAIAENDQFVVYTVRVPREALLGSDPYPCPALGDEKFGCCGLPGGSDSTVDGARARPVGVRPP
jgi:hypothetical protein